MEFTENEKQIIIDLRTRYIMALDKWACKPTNHENVIECLREILAVKRGELEILKPYMDQVYLDNMKLPEHNSPFHFFKRQGSNSKLKKARTALNKLLYNPAFFEIRDYCFAKEPRIISLTAYILTEKEFPFNEREECRIIFADGTDLIYNDINDPKTLKKASRKFDVIMMRLAHPEVTHVAALSLRSSGER